VTGGLAAILVDGLLTFVLLWNLVYLFTIVRLLGLVEQADWFDWSRVVVALVAAGVPWAFVIRLSRWRSKAGANGDSLTTSATKAVRAAAEAEREQEGKHAGDV
jgi:hypothetical protein